MTIAEAVQSGARLLQACSDSPRLDAELLLAQVLGLPRAALMSGGEDSVADETQRRFAALLERRAAGEPVAYLLGRREFWSLDLKVSPAVLVPRPETEVLVELALLAKDADASCTVLDLGTGSGAVALAIAGERPRWHVTAVDVSADALLIARDNARALGSERIDWRLGSWFEAVPRRRFDLIVGNPPYVAAADPALRLLAAEPRLALASGPTGLEALETIIAGAGEHLLEGGALLLEHGGTQDASVSRLMQQHGFSGVRTHIDLSGHPRVTQGTYHPQQGTS